jgi:hypothetical protein
LRGAALLLALPACTASDASATTSTGATAPAASAAATSPADATSAPAGGAATSAPPDAASSGDCVHEPPVDVDALPLPLAAAPLVGERPTLFGSASLGTPTRGALWAGVELRAGDGVLRAGDYGWGTARVVLSIERAVREVRRCHPGTPALYVGDLSRRHGGWLRPHRSHQAGLDADIGYYYIGAATWYQRATQSNLDVVRTWALVDALLSGGDVDTIFMDRSIQDLLKAHVATLPEGRRPPADLFQSATKRDAVIQHAWGHATHFHVRFRDEQARSLGTELDRRFGSDPRAAGWLHPRR